MGKNGGGFTLNYIICQFLGLWDKNWVYTGKFSENFWHIEAAGINISLF